MFLPEAKMHFVVCIKQVPDSAQIRVHPVTNTIMRQGVPTIINPYDLFSLEEALRLRDKVGGEVTVLTMGPPMASESLRKALCCTEQRAIQFTHEAHTTGRAIVWTGPKEVAELKAEQIQSFHEIRGDGRKLGPLGVMIEPAN